MAKKIKVLIIEDSEDDALLLVENMRSDGKNIDHKIIETAEELRSELSKNSWEVILSDYNLPSFNAFEALKIYKDLKADIPFIVISGTIGEDSAVGLMKAGAHDFITKENLSRLNSAIERELEQAKHRKEKVLAEKNLKESLDRLDLVVKATDLGMWDWQIQTGKLTFNSSYYEMLDFDVDEMNNEIETWQELLHPDDRQKVLSNINNFLEGKSNENMVEYRARCKSGNYKWILGIGRITERDSSGNPLRMSGVNLDIDKQKRSDILRENELRDALEQTIGIISCIVELRDAYTAGHQRRVAALSVKIAQEMKLKGDVIENIKYSSLIHDLGKIAIPASILNKPGRLSDIEMQLIKSHPTEGSEILKNSQFLDKYRLIILQHHERLNGSGYPFGLKKDKIRLEARIMAIADVVEAMTSHRPYRPALEFSEAIDELNSNKKKLYEPEAVDACISIIRKEDFQF